MSRAKVTVCIPAYDKPDFLRDALTSLCDQGLARDEYAVAISDDASPTDLRPMVSTFEDRLQIVYARSSVNNGHIANFERAASLARTPYISFLSHDDLVAPGQLARALSAIAGTPDAVLAASLVLCQRYPGAIDTNLQGTFLRGATASFVEPYVWNQTEWMALSLTTTPLSMVGSVFHAETFKKCAHWREFPLWHDRLMLAEMGLHGSVVSLPWIGGHYRVGSWQLSSKLWTTDLKEFLRVSELILRLCEERSIAVTDFWVDQLCQAQPDECIAYLHMLNRALPRERFDDIKHRAEQRLSTRLHLGGRLDRLGIPRPILRMLREFDRVVIRRQK
jgi:glycosyltransferase involved in cell wall biosynthesis